MRSNNHPSQKCARSEQRGHAHTSFGKQALEGIQPAGHYLSIAVLLIIIGTHARLNTSVNHCAA